MTQMQEQIKQLGEALENAAKEVDKLESSKAEKDGELEVKRVEANTKAYDAVTKRLQALAPLLTPMEVQQLAEETKREAMAQPDPGMPPSETMAIPVQETEMDLPQEVPPQEPVMEQAPPMQEPPPEETPQEQPPTGGFFTPDAQDAQP
jgi:hypothetical protein